MSDCTLSHPEYYPAIQVLVLFCGTLMSSIIAYANNHVSLYLPFISETGAFSPEMGIFSYCLIVGSFLGIVVVLFYYLTISQHSLMNDKIFSVLNNTALIVGIMAMFGLAGVAAFPMTTVFWAHLVFAGMYFVGSGIYLVLVSTITYRIQGVTKLLVFRATLSICIMLFLFLIVILFPLSLKRWHQFNETIPARKTPENKGFTLLLISSVLEWSIELIIIAFTLTLIIELRKYKFEVSASDPNKTTAGIDGADVQS